MEKSPFQIKQKSLPDKICSEITRVAMSNAGDVFTEPVHNDQIDSYLKSIIVPNIETHFDVKIVKSDVTLESHGVNTEPTHACESCVFSNGKWYRNKDIDFITLIFLKNHLESVCLLYTSPSPRDKRQSRMPSSA